MEYLRSRVALAFGLVLLSAGFTAGELVSSGVAEATYSDTWSGHCTQQAVGASSASVVVVSNCVDNPYHDVNHSPHIASPLPAGGVYSFSDTAFVGTTQLNTSPDRRFFQSCGSAHDHTVYVGPYTSPYGYIPDGYMQQVSTAVNCSAISPAMKTSSDEGEAYCDFTNAGSGPAAMYQMPQYTSDNHVRHCWLGLRAAYVNYWPQDTYAGLDPAEPQGPCEAWDWTYEPSVDPPEFLSLGDSLWLTGSRSLTDALATDIEDFRFEVDWSDGGGWHAAEWAVLAEDGTAIQVYLDAPGDVWTDGAYIHCQYVGSPFDDYAWLAGDPGGAPGGDRACSWLAVTFPASTADTSEEVTVRVRLATPSWVTLIPGGVTALEVGRNTATSTWTDVAVDNDWTRLDTGATGSPLPLLAATSYWYAVTTDLTGTALEDEEGRWSVVCTDASGEFRIRAPSVGTVTPPAAVGTGGGAATWPSPAFPNPLPGGGDSGTVTGPGGSGGSTGEPGDGGGVGTGPGSGSGVGGDGFGYAGGDCFGAPSGTTWWNPFEVGGAAIQWGVGALRCVLVGLFVPDDLSILSELQAELETQFPFSLGFLLIEFASDLGAELEDPSGTGCFDMPSSFSFGSFSVAVSDVCIGDGVEPGSAERQLYAALMIAPLLWAVCTHAVRTMRGVSTA